MSDNRVDEVSVHIRPTSRRAAWMDAIVRHGAIWRRTAILIVLCAILAGIASSAELHDALLQLFAATEQVIDRHPTAGAMLFVAIAAVSAMVTFLSIAVVVPAAVFAWGEPASLLLLWVGWILGGTGTYIIGRFLGRPMLRWLVAADKVDRLELKLPRNAPFWLVLLVQLALPSEIPGYVLGLARYPLPRYLLALGLAELPYALATVRLGQSFLDQRSGVVLMVGAAIACLSLAAFYALRRVARSRPFGPGRPESTVTSREHVR